MSQRDPILILEQPQWWWAQKEYADSLNRAAQRRQILACLILIALLLSPVFNWIL